MRPCTVIAAVAFAPLLAAAVRLSPRQSAPTCVVSCVGTAAAATSCASADAQCLCVQPSFINQVAECYAAECTPEESAIGVIFGEQYCASIGVTVSIPAVVASVTAGATDAAASASALQASVTSSLDAESSSAAAASSSSAPSSSASAASAPASSASLISSSVAAAATSAPASGASTLVCSSSLLAIAGVGIVALF